MIFWIIACSGFELEDQADGWEKFPFQPEVASPIILAEDLITPRGIVSWKNGLLVTDEGSGELLYVENGETNIVKDGLNAPRELLVFGDEVLIVSADSIYTMDENETVLSDGWRVCRTNGVHGDHRRG